jgi:DNA mismatch repair protein MutS
MQQYREIEKHPPGMVLIFRVGDFFEMFGNDAEVGVCFLGLTLSSGDQGLPMAGMQCSTSR